jgi:Protein kinase domain/WD domain, G-beta repeat
VPGLLEGFAAGQSVAGYLLEEQLGAGGMAVVFKALDRDLGRRVALKILAPGLASDPGFRQRFMREAHAAAAVDDPHIIPVYEAGESDGVLFIAMRLVPGKDARTLLRNEGPMPVRRALAIVSAIAPALDAAHAAGLVHRDVKPANLLVDAHPDRPDHVYLTDFGLSKGALAAIGLTGLGNFLGTPSYCSPEQIQGQPVDGKADQYGLACSAFELLTGSPPFERDEGLAVLWAHLSEPPPSLSSARPELPATVDGVLARALAKDPGERFASCREFADQLRANAGLAPYNPRPELAAAIAGPATEVIDLGAINTEPGLMIDQASGGVEVTAVCFSPDGIAVAIGDMAGRVQVRAVSSGSVIHELNYPPGASRRGVAAISYRPDCSLLAVGGVDGTTWLWEVPGGKVHGLLANPESRGVAAVAFSPDGTMLAAADDNGVSYLWRLTAATLPRLLRYPASDGVLALAFSPNGQVLVTGDANGETCLWDVRSERVLAVLPGRGAGEVFAVAYTADGSVFATGHADGGVRLWDAANGDYLSTLARRRSSGGPAYAIACHPSGQGLAVGYETGGCCLWDESGGRPVTSLGRRDAGAVLDVAFSPDGRLLATGSSTGQAWLWSIATGQRLPIAR